MAGLALLVDEVGGKQAPDLLPSRTPTQSDRTSQTARPMMELLAQSRSLEELVADAPRAEVGIAFDEGSGDLG